MDISIFIYYIKAKYVFPKWLNLEHFSIIDLFHFVKFE